MKCFFCKGGLEERFTTFVTDLDGSIIIVKDVPSQVCTQCGETSYSDTVAEKLESIVGVMSDAITEIAVVRYTA